MDNIRTVEAPSNDNLMDVKYSIENETRELPFSLHDLNSMQKSLKKEALEEKLKSRETQSHLAQILLPLLPISCTWPTLCSWCAWKWHLNQLLVPLLLQVSQSHLVQLLLSMLHISCTRPTLFPWKWQLGQLLTPRLLQASPTHQGGVLLPQLAHCTGCPL